MNEQWRAEMAEVLRKVDDEGREMTDGEWWLIACLLPGSERVQVISEALGLTLAHSSQACLPILADMRDLPDQET